MMRMSSSIFPLWVWRYMKRMTVRGRGQSQQSTPRPPEKTPPRPKPPEKKAVIYFDVTRIKRVHVTNCRGTLIMLSEEDGRMLSPSAETARHAGIKPTCACHQPLKSSARCFFSQIPGRKKTGGREGWSRLLKRKLTASTNRQDWNTRSASIQPRWAQRQRGISPSVTHTQRECHQRAGDSRTSYNDGAAYATMLGWNLLF